MELNQEELEQVQKLFEEIEYRLSDTPVCFDDGIYPGVMQVFPKSVVWHNEHHVKVISGLDGWGLKSVVSYEWRELSAGYEAIWSRPGCIKVRRRLRALFTEECELLRRYCTQQLSASVPTS